MGGHRYGLHEKNSSGVWSAQRCFSVPLMTRILTSIIAKRHGYWVCVKNFLTLKLIKNPCAEKEAVLNSFGVQFPG
jgi:hypothetical protein